MSHGFKLTPPEGAARYTVEHRDGCILIYGAFPADALSVLAKLVRGQAFTSSKLAQMAGATIAFGRPADNRALVEKLRPEVLAHARATYGNRGLSSAAIEWLALGERGISSLTMFSKLTGINVMDGERMDHPHDGDDLSRCRLLLESCPELAPLLSNMATLSPAWAKLVAGWSELCSVMDAEAPNWRTRGFKTTRTDKLITHILEAA